MKRDIYLVVLAVVLMSARSFAETAAAPVVTEVAPVVTEVAPAQEGETQEAQKPKKYSKEGLYLRAFYVNSSIGDDFNDTIVLISPDVVAGVPTIEDGSGYGLALGSRAEGKHFGGGFEFSGSRTKHDITDSPSVGTTEASFWSLDMAVLVDIKTIYGLRPYVTAGVGINVLNIEDGAIDSGGLTDASYFGYSFFYGGGLAYFIIPSLSINAELGQRSTTFTSVEGVDIEDNLKGGGAYYKLGVSYVF